MTTSLRRRIFLGTTVALSSIVLLGALAVWGAARGLLYREIDATLRESAHLLSGPPRFGPHSPPGERPGRGPWSPPGSGQPNVREQAGGGPAEPPPPEERPPQPPLEVPQPPPEFRAGGRAFAQVVDPATGAELARSPSLGGIDTLRPPAPTADPPAPPSGPPAPTDQPRNGRLADGRPLRIIVVAAHTGPGPGSLPRWLEDGQHQRGAPPRALLILLASDAGPVVDDLRRLATVLAALWLLTTAMGVAVAVWLQRAVLRPVAGISQAIAGIDPANLQARVTMDVVPVEMRVVIERLNALLARLEDAFTRERTTIANIAHELRTPVAGLLLTLELAARQGGPAAATEPVRKSLRIAASMQAMITNLLMLSRLEAGQARGAPQAIDLDTALRDGWDLLEARADERQLEPEWETFPGLAVNADPEQLRMVVANILDNALSYAPAGSAIRITATPLAAPDPLAGGARVRVANAIEGTPPDCGQIFQAFWRGDDARATGLHCGLGLALVQRLASALGGTVTAETDEAGRFCIGVDLPGPPLVSR